jgi:Flp pilus assembly protein TadB
LKSRFILIEGNDTTNLKEHESYLFHWLFYSIGNGVSVTLKEIKDYAKASRTQSSFMHNYRKWVKKVGEEFKKYDYFGQSKEGLKTSIKVVLMEYAAVFLLFALGALLKIQLLIIIPLLIAS